MSDVGNRIKEERTRQGYSQNALAKRAGIAQATLNAIEASTKNPSVETVIMLARALGVKASYLLGEESGPKKDQETPQDPLIEQIVFAARRLTPERRRQLEEYARFLSDQP